MKKNIIVFLICLINYSQENKFSEVTENLVSNPVKENIHLHLNKTRFINGEHLWFTAYILNQTTQMPSNITTNLHVGIYDSSGREISRKLLRVENGLTFGDFEINNSFDNGTYFVLGWTNFMKNFEELEPFEQQIEVVGNRIEKVINDFSEVKLDAYPEGGNVISGAFNYVGIILKNPKKTKKFSKDIRLVNSDGEILISNIAINDEGFGKIGFMVQDDKNYFLETDNSIGSIIRIPIEKTLHPNIGISIDNMGKQKIVAKLVLSQKSLVLNKNLTHSIAIVQNTNVFIKNWKIQDDNLAISIDRDSIPYGLNTAILFDESLTPISRRMFFNHANNKIRSIKIDMSHKLNSTRDSLMLEFSSDNIEKSEINLSVSVLPGNSDSYNPKNSLVSSMLLKPYLKSQYEYNYDILNFNRFQNYSLDTKLLIEGWGKYDVDKIFKSNFFETTYEFENGIQVLGKVIDADLTYENLVLLIPEELNTLKYEVLKSNKSFSSHLILYKNDTLAISLIGKNGDLRKPKIEIEIDSSWKNNHFHFAKNRFKAASNFSFDVSEVEILPLNKLDNTIVLDEVVVKSNLNRDNSLKINSADMDGRYIGDYEINKYGTIRAYLTKLGFIVGSAVVDGVGKTVVKSRAIGNPVIPIKIAGMESGEGVLLNMSLSRVKTILHDIDRKRWIIIVPREEKYISSENRNKFIKRFILNGFAQPIKYFNPGYINYESTEFKRYGALYWNSNIMIKENQFNSIMVPTYGLNKFKIFIEGIVRRQIKLNFSA